MKQRSCNTVYWAQNIDRNYRKLPTILSVTSELYEMSSDASKLSLISAMRALMLHNVLFQDFLCESQRTFFVYLVRIIAVHCYHYSV